VARLEQTLKHRRGLDPQIILRADRGKHPRRIALEQLAEQPADGTPVAQPQHVTHLRGLDAARAVRDRLIENRKPITCGALGRARDQGERLGLGFDSFGRNDMGEMIGELIGRNAAQIETLAARQHGDRHLVHLGGGEQEFHMRGWLLERLEQTVEGRLRQHMDFVDDVDLVPRRNRGVAHRLDDLAHIVDAGVACRVHFNDIDVTALGDRDTRLAGPARVDGRTTPAVRPDAVQRLGDQPRGRGLADAPDAGQ